MYCTKYDCRYLNDDIITEMDDVTEDIMIFIRNSIYQEDFLNIFGLHFENNNAKCFEQAISMLYEKIKESTDLIELMKKASALLLSEDLITGLCVLYSYDYMYLTHKCVSEYLDTGSISQENFNKIKEIIK